MGCGGSKVGGLAAARAAEGGNVPLPSKMRPLLRRRLEEMKKKSHANVLKGSQTLSTKELLRHGSSEDGEETEDCSSKSSAKVAQTLDQEVEESEEVIYEKSSSRSDSVKEVKEEEYHHDDEAMINVNKEGDKNSINHDDETINVKEGDEGNINHDDETINVKEGDENDINHGDETINVKKVGEDGITHDDEDDDDDDDEGRTSNFDERMICHGSPSFRVYCIDVASDDDQEKDAEDTRKSMDTESIITKPKEEGSIVKKEKRERKGKRFGMGLPRKYLANVTAPCYAGGRGGSSCMGNPHSRLVQDKSSQ